jgi:S-adenosylmethionine decarboxylase
MMIGAVTRGTHIIAELSDCHRDRLADMELVRGAVVRAAEEAGAEVLQAAFHRFSPQGVSGVVVIAESHLSIHTWPELGYAAIDVYTCGPHTNPARACEYLAAYFEAGHVKTLGIERGLPGPSGTFDHLIKADQEAAPRVAGRPAGPG